VPGDDVADLGHVDEGVEGGHELVAGQSEDDLDPLRPQLPREGGATCQRLGHGAYGIRMTHGPRLDLSLFGDAHVQKYEETDGAEGHIWNGAPCLVLTTKGSRTGETRKHALIYGRDGDRYLIVGSMGGAPKHPQWYRNLQADPNVQVQVLAERFAATARTASPGEKPRLWEIMTKVWPSYDAYQARTEREIPVVILERR
jgi:deazaflavin-dependent oxidoreductase (nitroreductase family)